MTLEEYGKKAITTLTSDHAYGDLTPALMAQILGLVGESGEIAEKVKKLLRDKDGKITDEVRAELVKELGDVLWYINVVASMLGSSIDEVAAKNLEKVLSRKERGVTKGSGDNR